jgi:hypothetical protein
MCWREIEGGALRCDGRDGVGGCPKWWVRPPGSRPAPSSSRRRWTSGLGCPGDLPPVCRFSRRPSGLGARAMFSEPGCSRKKEEGCYPSMHAHHTISHCLGRHCLWFNRANAARQSRQSLLWFPGRCSSADAELVRVCCVGRRAPEPDSLHTRRQYTYTPRCRSRKLSCSMSVVRCSMPVSPGLMLLR